MTEQDWNKLLNYVDKEMMIPILGSGLTRVNTPNGSTPLYDYLAHAICNELNWQPENGIQSLQQVCTNEEPDRDLVRATLKDIYEDIDPSDFDYSLVTPLLSIPEFKMFLSTSIDQGFIRLLNLDQESKQVVHNQYYLQEDFEKDNMIIHEETRLAYIFNHLFSDIEFATDDEEHMEYLFKLAKSGSKTSKHNLLNKTKRASLLMLGCNFPDWYLRFMIRILKNKRFTQRGSEVYVVSDNTNYLRSRYFFDNFGIKIVQPEYTVKEFIDEFARRWQEKSGNFKDLFNGRKVFISYYRRDAEAATQINSFLRNRGVDTWFDDEDLKAGDVKENIQKQITYSTIFLPVISENILSADDTIFSKKNEWKWIQSIHDVIFENAPKPLIMPMVIDDTDRADDRIPELFRDMNTNLWPGQQDQFIKNLTEVLSTDGTAVQ